MSTPEEFDKSIAKFMKPIVQTPAESFSASPAIPGGGIPDGEGSDLLSFVGEFAAPMIAPGLLGMLGRGATLAGSAAFPGAAPFLMNPGTQAGVQAAAGYGGRKINQALGLEGEGMVGDIASAAVPGGFELGGAMLKGGIKGLLGRSAVGRETLEEQAVGRTRKLTDTFVAAPSDQQVNALYANAHAAGAKIPTKAIKDVATTGLEGYEKLEAMGVKALTDPQSQKLLQEVRQMPGEITMENMSRLRTRILQEARLSQRSTESGSGDRARSLFQLADSFDDALDDGVKAGLTNPAQRDAMLAARDAYYKKNIGEELGTILERKIHTGKDGSIEVVNIGSLKDDVLKGKSRESQMVRNYLKKTGQTDTFIKELNAIGDTLKKPIRIDMAAMSMMGIGGAGAGAALGPSVGLSPTMGAMAGTAAGGMGSAGIQYVVARLLTTSAGRRLVARTLQATDGVITPTAWSIFQNAAKAPGAGQAIGAAMRGGTEQYQ